MLMVALTMSLSSFAVDWLSPPDACIDGIAYHLDRITKEASVTYNGEQPLNSPDATGGYTGVITIPSSITHEGVTYKVTTIGKFAFRYCKEITSITIPNSVTNIEKQAFGFCSGLTSITIPNSVTKIGAAAFQFCAGITSIIIPNSVTSIEGDAFSVCEGLTSIKVPDSVTDMGEGVFADCTKLSSVTLSSGLKEIPAWTFSSCYALKSISIPENIIYIGDQAFAGCKKLKNVELPNTLKAIRTSAFENCVSITSLTIPNSVTYIGYYAFRGCTKLSSVNIPNKLESIEDATFGECKELTSIIIPSSVTKIEVGAFGDCPKLSSVINLSRIPQPTGILGIFSIHGDLHVPVGCKEAYQNTPEWRKFNIIEDAEEVAAQMIENLIEAIGTVKNTAACKSKITAARFAFDSLSKEVQTLVKNANILIEAEKTYEKLSGGSTGIVNINSDNNEKSKKYIENGKIVIVKNGKKFNINGLKQ